MTSEHAVRIIQEAGVLSCSERHVRPLDEQLGLGEWSQVRQGEPSAREGLHEFHAVE